MRWFYLMSVLIILLVSPIIAESQDTKQAATTEQSYSNANKVLTKPRCEDMSIFGVNTNMGPENVRNTLIKSGFEVRDERTQNGNLTGRLFGEKKPSGTERLNHSTGIVELTGDTKALSFMYSKKGTISGKVTATSNGLPGWNKPYILPMVENKVATFCGDMGDQHYKEHDGISCHVKDNYVLIRYTEHYNQIKQCHYRFEARPNLYNESISSN